MPEREGSLRADTRLYDWTGDGLRILRIAGRPCRILRAGLVGRGVRRSGHGGWLLRFA
ncbi:MAG: hypothetical protein ACP5E5_04475 [Acidobacteriaceae bacterium]